MRSPMSMGMIHLNIHAAFVHENLFKQSPISIISGEGTHFSHFSLAKWLKKRTQATAQKTNTTSIKKAQYSKPDQKSMIL